MKTVKKFLSVILALMMVLAAMPLSALPVFAVTSGDFEYSILSETDQTCEITRYTGSATALEIPSELDGYTVTSIGCEAFYWCTALESLTIPDSVTSIGGESFYGCTSLTSITIPDNVTSIDYGAFSDCTALTSITIPDSVTSIGSNAFDNTAYYNDATHWENDVLYIGNHLIKAKNTLSGAYTVRAGTKTIAGVAFYYCTSLTSVTIPDSVTSIGDFAFSGCTALTSITIPNSVTSIGYGEFRGCTALTEIKVDTGNPNYTSESGVLFNRNKTELICYPAGKQESSYTIPDSVTSIGVGSFRSCSSLTSVTIPNSVTSIGGWAFERCTALTSIVIPDSVTSIGAYAFDSCTSIISVKIPDSVTSIGQWAFSDCTALASIVIPDSVTSIGDNAFLKSSLKTIYGYTGSYAETFANSNGYTFVVLNTRGDINGDGAPSSADYAMIKAYAIGNESLDLGQKYVSDLNRDGAVDAYDAIYLDLYLNGYLDTL